GKWLELLKEIAPGVTRAVAIFNPETHSGQYWQSMEAAAASLAVQFNRAPALDAAGIESAVAGLAREPNGGVLVMPDAFTLAHRELIVALTGRHRLPAIYPFRAFTDTGGLLSYGMTRLRSIGRRRRMSIVFSKAKSRRSCRFRRRLSSS